VSVSQVQAGGTNNHPIATTLYDTSLLTLSLQTDMEKFATLAGFTTKASATTNLSKVLRKVMGGNNNNKSASPDLNRKSASHKRKTGMDSWSMMLKFVLY
jgi:hypothetical protein